MKKLLTSMLLYFILCNGLQIFAQDTISSTPGFLIVTYHQKAEYLGGDEALMRLIKDNLKYPEDARKVALQGTVYTRFTVGQQGEIKDVKVIRGVSKSIDDEAIRIVKNMPKWKPAKHEGNPVDFNYNLPIVFKLN